MAKTKPHYPVALFEWADKQLAKCFDVRNVEKQAVEHREVERAFQVSEKKRDNELEKIILGKN